MPSRIPIEFLLNPSNTDNHEDCVSKLHNQINEPPSFPESLSRSLSSHLNEYSECDDIRIKAQNSLPVCCNSFPDLIINLPPEVKNVIYASGVTFETALQRQVFFQILKGIFQKLQRNDKGQKLVAHHVGKASIFPSNRNAANTKKSANYFLLAQSSGKGYTNCQPHRGHRFPKGKVIKLERWFNENSSKPYLDKQTLEFLIDETKLSSSQVKNWVSNRRRKERTTAWGFKREPI